MTDEEDWTNFRTSVAGVIVHMCATSDTLLGIRTTSNLGVYSQAEFELLMDRLGAAESVDEARAVFLAALKACVSHLEPG